MDSRRAGRGRGSLSEHSAIRVHESGDLTIALLGPSDDFVCSRMAATIRTALERQGACISHIGVQRVEALERGLTGKAPLIPFARAVEGVKRPVVMP
jgi:hypothetical protein